MDDKRTQINLNSIEDALEFVSAAEKCNFGIHVGLEQSEVNGKSLLGLLTVLGCGRLNVIYNGENKDFSNVLKKFHYCAS